MKVHLLACLFVLAVTAPAQPVQTSIVDNFAIWPNTPPDMAKTVPTEKMTRERGDRVFSAISRPTLTAFFASNPNGAAVLVIPGGAYQRIAYDLEGTDVARWLNTLGIDAFVLKYRLPSEPHNLNRDVALQDAQRALRTIRAGHLSANVGHPLDPKRVGVIGFSAGGNLSAVLSTYHALKTYDGIDEIDSFSARPDFMILGYAWVPLKTEVQDKAPYPRRHIFAEAVSADTPPAFVFAGDHDSHVPVLQSQRVAAALTKAGVPVELHVFPGAPHGFGVRGTGSEKVWPELCAKWLKARGIIPN